MISRPFWLERVEAAWREAPIAWLCGVRRCGKTTLARVLRVHPARERRTTRRHQGRRRARHRAPDRREPSPRAGDHPRGHSGPTLSRRRTARTGQTTQRGATTWLRPRAILPTAGASATWKCESARRRNSGHDRDAAGVGGRACRGRIGRLSCGLSDGWRMRRGHEGLAPTAGRICGYGVCGSPARLARSLTLQEGHVLELAGEMLARRGSAKRLAI